MTKVSRTHLRKKRSDRIPYDVTYNELTDEQKIELGNLFEEACQIFSFGLQGKTSGGLNAQEVQDELQHHVYVMMRSLEKEDPDKGKTYNVVAYLRKGLHNRCRNMLDKFFDSKMVKDQLLKKFASDLVTQGIPDDPIDSHVDTIAAKEQAAHTTDAITRAAEKLGVEVDKSDWIVTALNVIRLGVHGKQLEGELFEHMDFIRKRLESRGYKTNSKSEIVEPKLANVEKFVRRMVSKNSKITTAQVIQELEARGSPYNRDSIRVLVYRCKGVGKADAAKNYLSTQVKELWDSGMRDVKEIQNKLEEMGVIFRPSKVRAYVTRLRNKENSDKSGF